MDEQIDWRGISGGVALGLAAMVIGSVIFARQRSSRRKHNRVLDFLIRSGILPKPKQARIGPIPVPEVPEGIPEVFLRAFR